MNTRPHVFRQDRPCPLAFLVTAAFASSLVWLWAVLNQVVWR
jgi:hypothetical protein